MAKSVFLIASLGSFLGTSLMSERAMADGALIWTPVRVAPRVYQTTVGVRLPVPLEASAGADLGLSTGQGGKLMSGSELATLWGKVTDSRSTLAGKDSRALVIRIDTLRGNGGVSLSQSKKWIYSQDLDLQASRSLNINYATTSGVPASVDLTQALTMTYPWAGTALSASSTVTSATGSLTGSLGLNQPIAPHLNLTASMADPLSATRSGDVRMRYNIKW
ncbi:hypothetical protein [Rhizobium sp. HT1-10]|uniref:hypothetical protein n=1 Tax=Rhizobium sp. HT1-10 TaxID=3111638 RepID=UPI003C258DA8